MADNILKRVLWWGDRLPYWGDSIVADRQTTAATRHCSAP